MEGRKHLNKGLPLAVREDVVAVAAENNNVSVAEEPLKLTLEDTGTLKSCMLTSEGKESYKEVRETKRGHSTRKLSGSQAKGVKRNLSEAPEHSVEIQHYTSSDTHERFAEKVEGNGIGSVEAIRRSGENGEDDGSRSLKRIKLKSSIISGTDYPGSAERGSEQDGKRSELSNGRNVYTGPKDDMSLWHKKGKAKASTDKIKQKWETQDRWKEKTHLHPGSDLDGSKVAQSRRNRDGDNRTAEQRSKDGPEGESSVLAHRTRLHVRQFTGSVQKGPDRLSIRDDSFGKADLKRGRDHESRSVEDSMKRRDAQKRSREEVDRAREHEVKLPAKDIKFWVEDHDVVREDKRISRDRVDRSRGSEVQGESLDKDRSTTQAFRQEERNAGNSRRLSRDLRQSRESGNRNKADQHREDSLTKQRGNRNFKFHRLSQNIDRPQSREEGFFKGNVGHRGHSAAHINRQHARGIVHGSGESHWRDDQDIQRDAYRAGRKVENDSNFVRNHRRIGKMGVKERFVQKPRSIDEGADLFRRKHEDQKSGKENVGHTQRDVRGADRPGSSHIKGYRHKVTSSTSETLGVKSGSSRRCSSKVVAPSQLDDKNDGEGIDHCGGTVTKASEEGEMQGMGSQENGRVDHKKQNESMNTVQRFEDGKGISQEDAGAVSQGERQMIVEIDNRQDVVGEDMLYQSKSNPLIRDIQKYSDKQRRRNRDEISEGSERLRGDGPPSKERSANQDIQESKSNPERQVKDDFKREGAAKHKANTERDVHERMEDMTPRRSVEARQLKAGKVRRERKERKEKSNESLLRQGVNVKRDKHDVSFHEHKHQKHRGSSHSVSPSVQKRLSSPREHRISTSPRRSGRDRTDWERFEKERHNGHSVSDSRFRRFGGGTSGLGGYSPRRRRSEAAIKTPSPPPRSPERRKPQTWDSIPPGMDTSMIAAISAAHQAAVRHALVTLATVAPLVPGSMLVSPAATPTTVSSGLPTVPSMIPSLLPQVNPAVTAVTLTQATRPLRRLYVGNVPATVSDGELLEFMNAAMLSANANHLPGTKPCINCSVNLEKSHAFAEFITPEDATAALAFDGVTLHGTTLKIRRPKDFVLPSNAGIEMSSAVPDMVSSNVTDSPHKVFVGGIPSSVTVDKVKEIVTAFGQLKAYHWEVDHKTQRPRAFAFLEYMDPAATLNACAGLNGMRLGSGFLTVVQATPDANPEILGKEPCYGIPEHARALLETPSRVLELHNLVTAEEVPNLSKEDTEELMEDVRLECTRFGNVKSTHMVQPWAHADLEIENTSPGKIETVAVKIVRGVNLDYGTVPELVQEEVTEDDTEEEQPMEKLETLNEMSQSPVGGHVSGSFDANEDQMPATDVRDHLSSDQLGGGNEKCDNRSGGPAIVLSSPAVFGNVNKELQPSINTVQSETIIPLKENEICPNENETQDALEQDIGDGVGLSSDSMTTDEVHSTTEWETSHVGNIYVEFSREEAACEAAHSLHGRFFAGRKVAVCYFPLKLYQKKFQKGIGPRTFQEKQALALAVQGHLTAHIRD